MSESLSGKRNISWLVAYGNKQIFDSMLHAQTVRQFHRAVSRIETPDRKKEIITHKTDEIDENARRGKQSADMARLLTLNASIEAASAGDSITVIVE